MTDARPFRPAMSEEKAREQLIERAAIEFDPAVVTSFLSMGHLDELRSFAKIEQPVEFPKENGFTFLPSFMR
jgi:HD-GYP domain-containing protein (c-di-GMP phosphodiesterase class II)